MSGKKGRSGGARKGAGRYGATEEALVKILPSVLPETFAAIRLAAAKQEKGRLATGSGFGGSILNQWEEKGGKITGEVKYSAELPGLYKVRRLQVTCWVKKETALKLYERALQENKSKSAIAGEILDIWATRQAALSGAKDAQA